MIKYLPPKLRHLIGLSTVKQFTRFIVTGIISTIISYSVFLICLRSFHLHYIICNIIAFMFGISFGYNCNKRWTFGGWHHKQHHFAEYLAVYLTSLMISIAFLKITVDGFGIIPEIAFILSIGITTCTNFLGTKFLVFKK
jgi:putative flippase GtrA